MNNQALNESLATYLNTHPWLILMIIWIIVWKGLALWKSAGRKEKIWFIALLVVNTIGILEIIYLAYTYWQEKKSLPPQN
jgi:methionyl-tRNA synthetase